MVVQTLEDGLCTLASRHGWDAVTYLDMSLSELYDIIVDRTVEECPHGYEVDSKRGWLWTLNSNGDRERVLLLLIFTEEEDND